MITMPLVTTTMRPRPCVITTVPGAGGCGARHQTAKLGRVMGIIITVMVIREMGEHAHAPRHVSLGTDLLIMIIIGCSHAA